mgnify:CR=1 FL=1
MDKELISKASEYLKDNILEILKIEDYLYKENVKDQNQDNWFIQFNNLKWLNHGKVSQLPGYVTTANNNSPTRQVTRKLCIDFDLILSNNQRPINKKTKLIFKCNFNEHCNIVSRRLNDERMEIEESYNDQIFQIYENERLKCLSLSSTNICGTNPVTYFSNMTGGLRPVRENINSFNLEQELTNCSKDIKFNLGQLIFYSKLLPLNVIQESDSHPKFYKYFPNRKVIRYLLFASTLFEKTYNYWDAIGDTIDSYLKTDLKIHKVTFSMVMDKLNTKHPNLILDSEDFKWLYDYKEREFKNINSTRIKIVHYFNLETLLFQDFLKNNTDKNKICEIEKQLHSYVEVFKKELENCILGYEKALRLINTNYAMINNAT